ncbi:hypothetical protein CLOSBL3_10570 [Clostridiaceae bacterium BL-3]|nr:hypothetical protein CLOSBL3_10570 [Clostridiaceae bacterium BL-3]
MFSKKLVRKAHEETKKMKKEFPEVNYSFQFGLEMKYLLSEKEEENKVEEVKTMSMNYGLDDFTKEKCGEFEIEVPQKVVSDLGKSLEHTFEISYSAWAKYGKHRLYYTVDDGKTSQGYIDLDKKKAEGKGKVGAALYFGIEQGAIQL